MGANGGSSTITFTTNGDWTVRSSELWVTVSPSSGTVSEDGTASVEVSCTANTTYEARSATITITVLDLSQKVTVKQAGLAAVTSITLDKTEMTLETGSSGTLVATVEPGNAANKSVTWSTSDSSIATVDDGKVEAVSPGTATITAEAEDKQAACIVTCIPAPEGSSAPGLYLGIQGFNKDLYTFGIQKLDEQTIGLFNSFIDGLSYDIGTLLYYSADNAIDRLKNTITPSDLVNVAMLTFTDGLDEGSVSKKYHTDNYLYPSNSAYSSAIHSRITTESVSGFPIVTYTIGLRGSDVTNLNEFRSNLKSLASKDANAFEVGSMSEVSDKFHEIASQLNEMDYVQSLHIKIPEPAPNTRVRFTFDDVTSATDSRLYIEGVYDITKATLSNVVYKGMTCASGSTVKGKVDGIFVDFTFEGVYTDNNALITKDYVKEWKYNSSSGAWGVNSEFNKDTGFDTEYTRRSALIILNLDCSSSLGNDFSRLKTEAKSFIKKLVEGVKIVNGGGNNNTPSAIDLGLSVKWASFNIGANNPEEYGDYFAWGETETKSKYDWATYKWCNGSGTKLTKYNTKSSYGTVDNKTLLEASDDVAHVKLGGDWRMPTDIEWEELINKCTWTWTTLNGVYGRKVTGPNGNSIFLPVAGCWDGTSLGNAGSYGNYWSSSLYTDYPDYARRIYVDSYNDYMDNSRRYRGQSVRPVYGKGNVSVSSVSLNMTSLTLEEGSTTTLTATIKPDNATDKSVIWSSNNTSVATVSSSGVVSAIKAGNATITVKTNDGGKTATCMVTVKYKTSHYEWNLLGTGEYTDDVACGLYGIEPYPVSCTVYEEKTHPGLYKLADFQLPLITRFFMEEGDDYDELYALLEAGYKDVFWRPAEIIIDATDASNVTIALQDYGVCLNTRDGFIDGVTSVYNGNPFSVGTLENGVIAYPTVKGLLCTLNGEGYYYANQHGAFKLVLPGANNTPAWVDLGLPSGLKWGSCNIGASKPEEYGDYYAWGETSPKSSYDWTNYKFRTSGDSYSNVKFSKYNTSSSYGTVDNKTKLENSDDVARVKLGGKWRMPTDAEWTELRTKCSWTWTTQNGVKGRKVTGPNGKSIFLPAAGGRNGTSLGSAGSGGYYWSSSLSTDYPNGAWFVFFNSGEVRRDYDIRCDGLSVRPVSE